MPRNDNQAGQQPPRLQRQGPQPDPVDPPPLDLGEAAQSSSEASTREPSTAASAASSRASSPEIGQ